LSAGSGHCSTHCAIWAVQRRLAKRSIASPRLAIPPKEVRDLRGVMDGRSEKGIFLTTSAFSTNARAEAERRPGAAPIELVDGVKLFDMFKKSELGLKPRVVHDVDPAFFEQFG
jgi:restriction system protein